jgi:hypothetical protein
MVSAKNPRLHHERLVELACHVDEPALAQQPLKLAHVVVADRHTGELHASRPHCGNGVWQTVERD